MFISRPIIESNFLRICIEALASITYPDVSPNKLIPFTLFILPIPNKIPFIPEMLPLSIFEMLNEFKSFNPASSVATPNILGVSTNIPVMYAPRVTTCLTSKFFAIFIISSPNKYSTLELTG